ncbi:hypothetical protein EsDP_00000155 [Epichloe bromicola]|uniref:Copper-fist domain-containing protein n=1 Tax=Epichloe bromicola TaxID=79588 RepID=A0ABQ0CE34_9HYPO
MPLINGQKMACEPCIRGHRSTKCTHANERLMVPVRKPGRPLSSCPHPSSRPCACAAVTAAIPRRQKCHCGPPDNAAVEDQPAKDLSSTTAVTPPSPPKPATAGFRVQKQGAKVGPSRKQSVDIAGLQRMDSSQINVVPLYNDNGMSPQLSSTNGSPTPMPDTSLYASIAVTPSDSSFSSAESGIYPMFPYAPAPIMVPTGQAKPAVNGQNGVSTNGTADSGPETLKSCCGGRAKGTKSRAATPPPPLVSVNTSDVSSDDIDIGPAAKSCCSSKTTSSTQREKKHAPGHAPGVMPPPGVSFVPNGIMMPPPFQHPMVMASGMYPFYAQPNIFNFPPQYGSYLQPLQPEQWRQVMAAMAFSQNVGGQSFGMAGPLPMQQQQHPHHHHHHHQQQQQTPTTPNESSWTSHQCSCGDSCQCVGCAAHPYNEATQDYVRSAWNMMKEDPETGNSHANGGVTHLNGVTDGGANASKGEQEEAANASSNGTTTPIKPHHDGTRSPVAAQTPPDAESGASEEQALCASDFFFVSYPFGDSCAGETMSCPCGDDCQCIGCAIHNNPGPATGAKHEPI